MNKVIKIVIVAILSSFILFVSVAHCYIISDGQITHQVISFKTISIWQILQKAELVTRSEDKITAEGNTLVYAEKISIARARPVQIEIDGKISTYYSTSKTVKDFLNERGIKLANKDYLNLPLASQIENQKIVIKTYIEKEKVANTPINYKIIYKNDNMVAKGLIVKLNSGKDGTLAKHYKEIYFGGKKTKEEFTFDRIIKSPIDEVYLVGSATPPEKYIKMYNMIATSYSPTFSETDSNPWMTASGLQSGFGVVAVDPNVIPLGSLLYIEGYGYAVAGDTGGAIKGNKIDVFFYSTSQSNRWGVKNVRVYLLPGKWKFNDKLNY
jgi:3D (Asp-Asp-Asp) domain-containing protein